MQITRTSLLTGTERTKEINVTPEQLFNWQFNKVYIQDAMPNLDDNDREFIKTGITEEEWDLNLCDINDADTSEAL